MENQRKSKYNKVLTSELVKAIHEYMPEYHEYEVKDIVIATFQIIRKLIERGECVEVLNFGKFYLRKNRSKRMYDPKTKQVVNSPGRPKVIFEPNKDYKEKIRYHAGEVFQDRQNVKRID